MSIKRWQLALLRYYNETKIKTHFPLQQARFPNLAGAQSSINFKLHYSFHSLGTETKNNLDFLCQKCYHIFVKVNYVNQAWGGNPYSAKNTKLRHIPMPHVDSARHSDVLNVPLNVTLKPI